MLIHRPTYENLLIKYLTLPEIKILKGVRRCGKSSLLMLLRKHLLSNGIGENQILYCSFDEYEVPIDADAAWLKAQVDKALRNADAKSTFFVLLDEVQAIRNWEEVVRRLYKKSNVQIYLTGSNAHLLSSDLATLLSGRYIELEVMPLQFEEYQEFCKHVGWSFSNDFSQFEHFLAYGGMPGLFQFEQNDAFGKERMLSGIFDTVIMNDIALHSRVSDYPLLSKLIRYVLSTSGNLLSVKKVADTLSASGKKTSSETVEAYLSALESALILNSCEQYGLAGRELLRPRRKFYAIDNGLRNLADGFSVTKNIGFKLENVVYNQLRHWGFDVRVGALLQGEVDFVAIRGAERLYIQVSASVVDEAVMERETAALNRINDSFPKMILTLDGLMSGITDKGIRIQSVMEWCKENAL